MNNNDGYGSYSRECMKELMEKPAGEWKPLNQRTPNLYDKLLLGFFAALIIFGGVWVWAYIVHGLWLRLGR